MHIVHVVIDQNRIERRRSSVGLSAELVIARFAGSMPVLGITWLSSWERHFTLISLQALYVVWKDSTAVCFTTAFTEEKKLKNQIKKQADMEVGLGSNCPMLNV